MKTNSLKILLLMTLMLLMVVFGIVGCGGKEEIPEELAPLPTVTPTLTPSPTQKPTLSPEPTPEVYSLKDGYSPTTGLPNQKEYKPIAVVIENHRAARPLSGISAADWVYEIYVEGKITRLLAIFNDTLPAKVGPIRSARVNFLDIQQEWNSVFVHFGASVGGTIETCAKPRIPTLEFPFRADGHTGKNDDTFWRSDDRSAPHNAYNDLTKLTKMFEADIAPIPRNFCETVMTGGTDCNELVVAYNDSTTYVEYEYDAQNGVYSRNVDNKPFMDKETEEQITVTNIIMQRVDHSNPHVGRYTFEIMDMVGEGPAEFVMGGKHYTGTWKSDSIQDKTYFYLDNGEEITLLPGNTWVQVIYYDTEVSIGS